MLVEITSHNCLFLLVSMKAWSSSALITRNSLVSAMLHWGNLSVTSTLVMMFWWGRRCCCCCRCRWWWPSIQIERIKSDPSSSFLEGVVRRLRGKRWVLFGGLRRRKKWRESKRKVIYMWVVWTRLRGWWSWCEWPQEEKERFALLRTNGFCLYL